jgi:hypothetical protein
MILSTLLALTLSITNPQPLLVNSAIDVARIIGLPRLKTMDKYLAKKVFINEMETSYVFLIQTRQDFLKHYLTLNLIRSI